MTRSRVVRSFVQWLVLMLVFTVDTVGIVGAATLLLGGSFGAATAFWVLVLSLLLWAIPLARFVRPRTEVPVTEGSDPVARHDGQRGSAHRPADDGVSVRGGPTHGSTLARPFGVTTGRIPAVRVRVPAPRLDRCHDADDPVLPDATVPETDLDLRVSDEVPSAEESDVQALPAPTPADAPPPALDESMDVDEPDPGEAAQRLAEVLNLYERLETLERHDSDDAYRNSESTRHGVGERGLWDELVEDYGAESIDLRGAAGGACCITLASGDLVVYVPARRCWMWVTFETTDQPSVDRSVSRPSVEIPAESIRPVPG